MIKTGSAVIKARSMVIGTCFVVTGTSRLVTGARCILIRILCVDWKLFFFFFFNVTRFNSELNGLFYHRNTFCCEWIRLEHVLWCMSKCEFPKQEVQRAAQVADRTIRWLDNQASYHRCQSGFLLKIRIKMKKQSFEHDTKTMGSCICRFSIQ